MRVTVRHPVNTNTEGVIESVYTKQPRSQGSLLPAPTDSRENLETRLRTGAPCPFLAG